MPDLFARLDPADLAFLAAAVALIHVSRRWIALYALLALPGTALHELSHWLVAALLGGRPTAPTLLPERVEGRWRLGAVGLRNLRWYNALPIGCAPLLLAPLAGLAWLHAARLEDTHWLHWAALYLAAAATVSCLPSLADWRIVFSRPVGVVVWAGTLGAMGWLLLR
jgi:hypothetical protein